MGAGQALWCRSVGRSVGRHQSRAPIDEVLYIYACRLSVSFFCSRRFSLSLVSLVSLVYVCLVARPLLYPTRYYVHASSRLFTSVLHISPSLPLCLSAFLRLSRSLSLARHAPMLTRATHIRVHHVVILVQTQIQSNANAYSRIVSAARSSCAEARSRDLGTRTRACAGAVSVQYSNKRRGAPVLSSIGPARLGAPGCLWQ